jgi:hypothetical protein
LYSSGANTLLGGNSLDRGASVGQKPLQLRADYFRGFSWLQTIRPLMFAAACKRRFQDGAVDDDSIVVAAKLEPSTVGLLKAIRATRVRHREAHTYGVGRASQERYLAEDDEGANKVLARVGTQTSGIGESELRMMAKGEKAEIRALVQESHALGGDSASLANIRCPNNRAAPDAELWEPVGRANLRAKESIACDSCGFLAEREAKLARHPAISVQERRWQNAHTPEDFDRGNAASSQMGCNVQQSARVVGEMIAHLTFPLTPNGKTRSADTHYKYPLVV